MRMKKNFAVLLAGSILLTACGTGQSGKVTETKKDSNTEVSSKDSQTQEENKKYWEMLREVSDTSELPDWDGKKLEINVWHCSGSDEVINEWKKDSVILKEIERVTGVTVNVDRCFGNGGSTIDAKLPMVVASGDLPTVLSGWDQDKFMRELFDGGYLLDLTKYYENGTFSETEYWYPKEHFDKSIYSRMRTEDNRYYRYPSFISRAYTTSTYKPKELDEDYYRLYGVTPKSYIWRSISVRDDVLRKVYPDAMTLKDLQKIYVEKGSFTEDEIFEFDLSTQDDFEKLLEDLDEAIKDGGFVGLDGRPMETMNGPHTDMDNWGWMSFLPKMVSNMSCTGTYFDWTNKDPNKPLIEWSFSSERYKKWMLFLNSLVKKNIISQNSLVDNGATFSEKINNGHYAILYYTDDLSTANNATEEWDYRPVWFRQEEDKEHYTMSGIGGGEMGVFKKAVPEDQIEQLLHYFEYCRSAVGMNCRYWGPKSAGLFTEDDKGKRKYVTKELEDYMLYNVDNGEGAKYGFSNSAKTFYSSPVTGVSEILDPKYLNASEMRRNVSDTNKFYNPGVLKGYSLYDVAVPVFQEPYMYTVGGNVEGVKQFLTARTGFEVLMTKAIVASTDEDFEKLYKEMVEYATDNGLTEEALKEYTDLFIEANKEPLKNAGIIK